MSDSDINRLLDIVERLRDPESGCPWDLKQTFRSVAPYTLEEAFEVVEAIESGDTMELRDELGDLLFQVVLHARMAQECAEFDFADVVRSICDKMIQRHPHVFGDVEHEDEDALRAAWEQQKQQERMEKGIDGLGSLMAGVAKALPALVRAEKLQRRAARVAFDWGRPEPVVEKIREELVECTQAMESNLGYSALEEEVGDLLFSCVNLARHLRIDAEQALRGANAKFERRFRYMEQGLVQQGLAPGAQARVQMEALWEASKRADKHEIDDA